MIDQADGYVTEIDYPHAFYPEMAPALHVLALLLQGIAPPPALDHGSFSYAELGCGQGLTSNLLAAIHPAARFEAIDLLPSHIDGARRLAERAGSGNVTYRAESFAEFQTRSGPGFDVIALHGVWTWVSADNRARLIDIVRRRLNPGGLVYVSYNALPGWAAEMPVRRLLRDQVDAAPGPLPARIDQALGALKRLAALGGYFAEVPAAAKLLASLDGKTDGYIAHEFLNRDWTCFYHADVAADFAPLSFAGSATLLDHGGLRLPDGAAALLRSVEGTTRETLRDTLAQTRFRRDLFMDQPHRLDGAERERRLRAMRFALCVPRAEVPQTLVSPVGELALDQRLYGPLADALAAGPVSLGQLAGDRFDEVLGAVVLLAGLGVATPVVSTDAGRCRAFNHAVLRANRDGAAIRQLASPVLGTGLVVETLDRLFLRAEAEGAEPVGFVWDVLRQRGKRLQRDGRWLEGESENRDELARLYGQFSEARRPWLRVMGI